MKTYPSWFDHHPDRKRLIQRFNRQATFILGKDDPFIRPLFDLIEALDKQSAMVLALQLCQQTHEAIFKDTAYDELVSTAIANGQAWLNHTITMTTMRPIILHIHALAKHETDPLLVRYLHAIAQALSTLHCQDHLKGWYLYALSAQFYHDPFQFDVVAWIRANADHIIQFSTLKI